MLTQIEKWDFYELALQVQTSGNPFLEVSLAADFKLQERTIHVTGFYDGEDVYKIRFMPDQEGTWSYTTHSNLPALDGQKGEVVCIAATGNNHGPVRVADNTHFAYEDGTRYLPVGTTCYVWNLQGDELEERTLKTLDGAPFNKMRMCVFPKRYTYNRNEPPSYPFAGELTRPWQPANLDDYRNPQPPDGWDFSRFNPAYFRHLEQRILDLRARGIEADLIVFHPYDFGAWGFDRLPPEVNDRYLKYLVARLSAFRNLWWSFANEYDLFQNRTTEDWDHYFQVVQALDPYNHLRSIHNCRPFYDHSKPWVTHCSVQHGSLNQVGIWLAKYNKPVVVDECGYEGDIHLMWGDLAPDELVLRFWIGFTLGGYVGHGETYMNAEDVLWWSKGGELTGESVARIAFLRQVFEQAPQLSPVMRMDTTLAPLADEASKKRSESFKALMEGSITMEAGGFHDQDYFLFYYGVHQPRLRKFNLPEGNYQIDLIDTWNMTIETWAESASGHIGVTLPGKKYMAVRIRRG